MSLAPSLDGGREEGVCEPEGGRGEPGGGRGVGVGVVPLKVPVLAEDEVVPGHDLLA